MAYQLFVKLIGLSILLCNCQFIVVDNGTNGQKCRRIFYFNTIRDQKLSPNIAKRLENADCITIYRDNPKKSDREHFLNLIKDQSGRYILIHSYQKVFSLRKWYQIVKSSNIFKKTKNQFLLKNQPWINPIQYALTFWNQIMKDNQEFQQEPTPFDPSKYSKIFKIQDFLKSPELQASKKDKHQMERFVDQNQELKTTLQMWNMVKNVCFIVCFINAK